MPLIKRWNFCTYTLPVFSIIVRILSLAEQLHLLSLKFRCANGNAETFKHLKYTQTTPSNTIKVNKHNSRTSQLKEGKFKFILVLSPDPTLVTRRNGLVNQVEFLGLKYGFATL